MAWLPKPSSTNMASRRMPPDSRWTRSTSPRASDSEALTAAGKSDWRLPNAKELRSIVDYTRAPAKTKTAALDPLFKVSGTESYFWTGTTHQNGAPGALGSAAVFVAFGCATQASTRLGSSHGFWTVSLRSAPFDLRGLARRVRRLLRAMGPRVRHGRLIREDLAEIEGGMDEAMDRIAQILRR